MKILRIAFLLLASSLCIAAQTSNTSKLTGVIYDGVGAVIGRARVTAVGGDKTFAADASEEGSYVLVLPFVENAHKMSKYDITVERSGFKRTEIKGYIFGAGPMRLDIALEAAGEPHYITGTPVKTN